MPNKGDLLVGTGTGILERQPAGANGTLIGYDSAQTLGIGSVGIGTGLTLAGGVLSNSVSAYTDEQAQDAIGAALLNTSEHAWTYDDTGNHISVDLIANSVGVGKLHAVATARLFGRSSAGAGAGEEISIGTGLSLAAGVLSNTVVAPVAANPSGLIGMVAVNGAAATFERSDAAHAIDPAINPTWTSTHNWTRSVTAVYWQTWASTASPAVTWGFANNAGPNMSLDEVGVAQRLLIYGSASASGPGIGVVNFLGVGYNPAANTTAGDLTAARGHFGANAAFGANDTLSNVGGVFHTSWNTATRPTSDNVYGGLSVTWNYSSGGAEVDLWNAYDAVPGGFSFKSKTGAATHRDLLNIDTNGNALLLGYFRVGSLGTPTNVTAGDFTTIRGFITNLSVGTTNVASVAGADLLVLASATRSTFKLGDDTSGGYQRIEMQSRYTGASGAGHWMFESIDTEFYFYSLTNSAYLWRASPTGEFGFGGEAAVAGVALSIPVKTYAFRFHTTSFLPSVLTDSVKVIDSLGNIRYIGLYSTVG